MDPVSCKYSAGRHLRHAALNYVSRIALESVNTPFILESVGSDRIDDLKPNDISVFPIANDLINNDFQIVFMREI